jgi:trk/ktr system potassium uptake protein
MKQFAVIGLGNFGNYLATALYAKGHDVLAIDKNPQRVQEIKDHVSQAVVADTTDPKAIEALGVEQLDTVVICIGTLLNNSILTALNLKDSGVRRLLAMAISEAHGRILYKIGVSEVFFPEKDMALSLAERMHTPNIIEYLPFIEGYSIIQIAPPNSFIGHNLKSLDLINRYGVQVIAVKETVPDRINIVPTSTFVLKDSDILILLGPNKGLEKLRETES